MFAHFLTLFLKFLYWLMEQACLAKINLVEDMVNGIPYIVTFYALYVTNLFFKIFV